MREDWKNEETKWENFIIESLFSCQIKGERAREENFSRPEQGLKTIVQKSNHLMRLLRKSQNAIQHPANITPGITQNTR